VNNVFPYFLTLEGELLSSDSEVMAIYLGEAISGIETGAIEGDKVEIMC